MSNLAFLALVIVATMNLIGFRRRSVGSGCKTVSEAKAATRKEVRFSNNST